MSTQDPQRSETTKTHILSKKNDIFFLKSRFLAAQEELEAPLWIWFTLKILLLIFQEKIFQKLFFVVKKIRRKKISDFFSKMKILIGNFEIFFEFSFSKKQIWDFFSTLIFFNTKKRFWNIFSWKIKSSIFKVNHMKTVIWGSGSEWGLWMFWGTFFCCVPKSLWNHQKSKVWVLADRYWCPKKILTPSE